MEPACIAAVPLVRYVARGEDIRKVVTLSTPHLTSAVPSHCRQADPDGHGCGSAVYQVNAVASTECSARYRGAAPGDKLLSASHGEIAFRMRQIDRDAARVRRSRRPQICDLSESRRWKDARILTAKMVLRTSGTMLTQEFSDHRFSRSWMQEALPSLLTLQSVTFTQENSAALLFLI
jgi:hypothetical protein